MNPSHAQVFKVLDALGLARIPDDGDDAAQQPGDAAEDDAAEDDAPAPQPVAAPAKRATGAKAASKTGAARSKAASG